MDLQLCAVYTSVSKPTSGKVIYLLFLMTGTLVSTFMFFPDLRNFFVVHSQFCDKDLSLEKCDLLVGHILLYRIYFGMFVFFLFMAVVNCQASFCMGYSALLENGLWFLKWNLFCLSVLLSLLLPEGEIGNILMHTGWFSTIIVMFMEVLLIIDFAKNSNFAWVFKMDKSVHSNTWYFGLVIASSLLYTISLGFAVYFYVLYTSSPGCQVHAVFVTTVLILCLVAALLSLHPRIGKAGVLQSAIVTLYAVYLIWSSLLHSPSCNPAWENIPIQEFKFHLEPNMVIDIALVYFLLFYGIYRVHDLDEFLSGLHLSNCCSSDEQDETDEIVSEKEQINHYFHSDYLHFYVLLILIVFFIMAVMSNFYTPEGILGNGNELISVNGGVTDANTYMREYSQWVAMSIKMTLTLVFVVLFIWSSVSPFLFSRNR